MDLESGLVIIRGHCSLFTDQVTKFPGKGTFGNVVEAYDKQEKGKYASKSQRLVALMKCSRLQRVVIEQDESFPASGSCS